MLTPVQGRFEGPIATGPQGQHIYLYYAPGSRLPQYVAFTPDGRSFFSDAAGQPISSGISGPSVAIIGGIVGGMLGGGAGAVLDFALGALATKLLPNSQQT